VVEVNMPQGTLEERVAYLEGKVEEQSRGYGEIREAIQHLGERITSLDQKLDRFREELSSRIDALDQRLSGRIDALSGRVDALDQKVDRFRDELSGRIDALGGRVDALDQKVDRFRDELSGRIDALDQKVSRHFVWMVGIQITILVTVVGVLAAALFRG
jgi:chromosome segregation ATPase